MLIGTLVNAYYWLSLVNQAKEGNESSIEIIKKTDKENLLIGHPSIEDQLKKMQKGNDGSLISNDGIDWGNNCYIFIPELDSKIAAVRVLEYYYSIQEDKDIQSWDDITNKTLDGYIANIGYQLILDGNTLYEPWRDEMYNELKRIFNNFSEYYLKKAIAHLWIKKFNIAKIDSKENLYHIARRKRYSIFRFLDNDIIFYSIFIIWALGFFIWLISKEYNIGGSICLFVSLLCGYGTNNKGLSKLPFIVIFIILLISCTLIALSAYVDNLNHYGTEFAKYIIIWSIIGLVSTPIFFIQEEKQKQLKKFDKDYN